MRIAAGIPVARLLADYEASCARDRELAASPGLDTPARRNMSGRAEPVTLRWILVHLIGETARHVLGQVTASWAYTTAIPDGNSAHADVTSYTYTPAGQAATVADNNGNTWTYGYNLAGQKTAATDPGTTGTSGPDGKAGKTAYAYDGAGEPDLGHQPAGCHADVRLRQPEPADRRVRRGGQRR